MSTNVATTGVVGDPLRRTYQATAAAQTRGLAAVNGASDPYASVCAAANAIAIGVFEETNLNAGDAQSVVMLGEAIAIAGAAITAGQYVITTASGQFIPSTATADKIVGRAISSASNQGDEFVLLVLPSIR